MECWNNEKAMGSVKNIVPQLPGFPLFAAGVYLSMFHKDATPSFQYSNIPTFQLRCEAELSSNDIKNLTGDEKKTS
jgi:hypothetical protein